MFSPCVPERKKKAGLARTYSVPKDVDRNAPQEAWGGGSYMWHAAMEQGFVRKREIISSRERAFPSPPAGRRSNENFRSVAPCGWAIYLKK